MMTVISMLLIIPWFISAEEISVKNKTVKITTSGCTNFPEIAKTNVSTTVILILVYLALWIITLVLCVFIYVKYIHRNYVSDSSTQTEKLDICPLSSTKKGQGKLRNTDCQFFVQVEQPVILNDQNIIKLEGHRDTPNKNHRLLNPTNIDKLLLKGNEVGLPQTSGLAVKSPICRITSEIKKDSAPFHRLKVDGHNNEEILRSEIKSFSVSAPLKEIKKSPEEEEECFNKYNRDVHLENNGNCYMPVFGNCSNILRYKMVTIDEEDDSELPPVKTNNHATQIQDTTTDNVDFLLLGNQETSLDKNEI